MFKRKIIAIDREDEMALNELESLRKQIGSGRFSFRMGLDVDRGSGYNKISPTGKNNFEYLLTTLSSDELYWMLATLLKEIARDKKVAQYEAKEATLAQIDPNETATVTPLAATAEEPSPTEPTTTN